jgi:glycosyltransferase involved in cell wall biosynthesis
MSVRIVTDVAKNDITVAIPTIPVRQTELFRALSSVITDQTLPADAVSIAVDLDRQGAPFTRQRALDAVKTKWVAFLDDDDWYYPTYLETCARIAVTHMADVVYTWFDGNNPFPMHRGRQWNPDDPHHLTMTLFVRTELAKSVGFATDHPDGWILPQEDWRFILGLRDAGARFAGTDEVLWHYTVNGKNTSGRPDRW